MLQSWDKDNGIKHKNNLIKTKERKRLIRVKHTDVDHKDQSPKFEHLEQIQLYNWQKHDFKD